MTMMVIAGVRGDDDGDAEAGGPKKGPKRVKRTRLNRGRIWKKPWD